MSTWRQGRCSTAAHWLPLNQRITYKVAVELWLASGYKFSALVLSSAVLRCGTDSVESCTKQAETKQFVADF